MDLRWTTLEYQPDLFANLRRVSALSCFRATISRRHCEYGLEHIRTAATCKSQLVIHSFPSIGAGLIGDIHVDDRQIVAMNNATGTLHRLIRNSRMKSDEFGPAVSPASRLSRSKQGGWILTDPSRHRVTLLTDDGSLQRSWGKRARTVDGFQGCCNPMAVSLADDQFIAVEAGQLRIKAFDLDGEFVSEIAGPQCNPILATKVTDDAGLRCAAGGVELAQSPDGTLSLLHARAQQIIQYRRTTV